MNHRGLYDIAGRVEFISGGYFLTKRGPYRLASGPAPRGAFVTISPQQVHFFPAAWALSWTSGDDEVRLEAAAALDIPASVVPALIEEVTRLFNERTFGWPNVMPSVAVARQLLQLLPQSPGWLLVGVGLAVEDVDRLLLANAPPAQVPGFAPNGAGGLYELLCERKPLEPGGVELGFDVLNIAHGQVEQSNLDFDLGSLGAYDGALNGDGLFPEFASARRAAQVLTNNAAVGSSCTLTPAQIVLYDATG